MPEGKPGSRQTNRRGGGSADKRKTSRQNSADSRRDKNGGGGASRKESSPPEDLGPLLDSHSVLEHFSREHAGTSPLATMLKEFASRLMMLYDVGADSGANFSEYWEMMLQVRAEGHAQELRGMGPLFRFVYQHVYAAEHAAEVSRTEQLHVSKAEQQRTKIADQVTTSLAKVQKSLDALLQQSRQGGAALHSTQSRAALDGVLQDLEGLQETHLDQLSVPVAAVDHALSKTRDAVMAANMTRKAASPRRSAPQSPARQLVTASSSSGLPPKAPHVPSLLGAAAVSVGSDEMQMLPASARGVPASPNSARLGNHASPHLNTARQPHPSLPAVRCEVRSVKSQQQALELPLRPFASPFGIPAQFDVEAFEAVANQRRKHREWLRSRASREHALASIQSQQQHSAAGSSPQSSPAGVIDATGTSQTRAVDTVNYRHAAKRPTPPAATAAASMQSARIAAATATTARDEDDVMKRLRELRADVIGPESDTVIMTGPKGKTTLPAASKPNAPPVPSVTELVSVADDTVYDVKQVAPLSDSAAECDAP